jgi:predicted AlkP superfamily pyrophosphatase or phosphodiesterase
VFRPTRRFLCAALLALAPFGVPAAPAVDHGLAASSAVGSVVSVQASRPIVILISIDGWRWDYLDRYHPPAIGRLAANGVRADGLVPVYPSKTFPNHYTLVTGQYPNRHGIVSNSMIDPALPGRFTLSNRDVQQDTRWWGSEPLWVTVERQGQIAGTMFWPGSDSEIAGDRPTYWRSFDHELPNVERVDQLLEWLRRPAGDRPTLLTLYFSTVDTAGHDFGPDSPEAKDAVHEVDESIARLLEGVAAARLLPSTNFVVVSDHGMAALSPDRLIVLDDFIDVETIDLIDSAPIVGANPRRGSAEAIYAALKGKHPALQIYRRDELPERYRLRAHPRLPAIVGVADDGWHVMTREMLASEDKKMPGGNHGYEPRNRSMHGVFIASGPKFRSGLVVPAFENVHVYELLCRVLGVRPASNDGDPAVTAGFLR